MTQPPPKPGPQSRSLALPTLSPLHNLPAEARDSDQNQPARPSRLKSLFGLPLDQRFTVTLIGVIIGAVVGAVCAHLFGNMGIIPVVVLVVVFVSIRCIQFVPFQRIAARFASGYQFAQLQQRGQETDRKGQYPEALNYFQQALVIARDFTTSPTTSAIHSERTR
jgi:dolichyl-phosphate-mannose--protein O-mannosyl transferase